MKTRLISISIIVSFLISPMLLYSQSNDAERKVAALIDVYDYSSAIKMADAALISDSTNITLLLYKSKSLSALYQWKAALETLGNAYRRDSSNLLVLAELSAICQKKGDLDGAIKYTSKACSLQPSNVYFRTQLATLTFTSEEYHKCIGLMSPIFKLDTTNLYAARLIADCYYESRTNDSAVLWYQTILRSSPNDLYSAQKLANVFIRTEDYTRGLTLTESYIKYDTSLNPVHKLNAFFYYLLQDYNTAKQRFLQCIEAGDTSIFVYRKLGLTYYKQQVFDSAERYFRKAFFLDTTDAETCFYYGVSASRSFMPTIGILYLSKTMQMVMPSENFLTNIYIELSEAYNSCRRSDTALIILEKGASIFPQNKRFLFRIAYQYDQMLNDSEKAIPYYEAYLKDSPAEIESNDNGTEVSFGTFAQNRLTELKKKYINSK